MTQFFSLSLSKYFRHAKFFFFSSVSPFWVLFCYFFLRVVSYSRQIKPSAQERLKNITMKFFILFVLISVSAESRKWIIVWHWNLYFNEWMNLIVVALKCFHCTSNAGEHCDVGGNMEIKVRAALFLIDLLFIEDGAWLLLIFWRELFRCLSEGIFG